MTGTRKTPENAATVPEQLCIRREKHDRPLEAGTQPYLVEVSRTYFLKDIREEWGHPEVGKEIRDVVTIISHVMSVRNTGRLCFVALQEGDGTTLQAMLFKTEVGEDTLAVQKADVGMDDSVLIADRVIFSRRGKLSVMAAEWQIASKALRPLPVSFADLSGDSRVCHRYTAVSYIRL